MTQDSWEKHSNWWQREFTRGADPEYEEQILPLLKDLAVEGGRVIDIGCGEGQVARVLSLNSAQVFGVDPAWNQISEAARRSTQEVYGQASAMALPFKAGAFDAAVACLVFEHITALRQAIMEVSRVLIQGGTFIFLLNHPLLQTPGSGWVDDYMSDPPSHYWRVGHYLVQHESLEEVQLGVRIPFVHRPLSEYVNTLSENGLQLERMLEPSPPAGFLERNESYRAAAHIPRLLVLICRKR